jgi:hypothetical protein
MPGQEIEIMAGVGAFSKSGPASNQHQWTRCSFGEDGAAHLKVQGGGLGKHTIPVHIVYKDQDGKDR